MTCMFFARLLLFFPHFECKSSEYLFFLFFFVVFCFVGGGTRGEGEAGDGILLFPFSVSGCTLQQTKNASSQHVEVWGGGWVEKFE